MDGVVISTTEKISVYEWTHTVHTHVVQGSTVPSFIYPLVDSFSLECKPQVSVLVTNILSALKMSWHKIFNKWSLNKWINHCLRCTMWTEKKKTTVHNLKVILPPTVSDYLGQERALMLLPPSYSYCEDLVCGLLQKLEKELANEWFS